MQMDKSVPLTKQKYIVGFYSLQSEHKNITNFHTIEMSTIYLGFNIENVTFNIKTTSSFPCECPVCLHNVGAFVCFTQISGAFIDANDI